MKTQRWCIENDRLRIYPDVIDGKTMEWAEYSRAALQQLFWVLDRELEAGCCEVVRTEKK